LKTEIHAAYRLGSSGRSPVSPALAAELNPQAAEKIKVATLNKKTLSSSDSEIVLMNRIY
jgi:hypothetical protein